MAVKWNKNRKEKETMMTFLNKHRKLVSAGIFFVALVLIVLPAILYDKSDEGQCVEKIEVLYFASQIVSAIFIIAGSIVAVWQYYLSTTTRKKEVEFSRVERAIELSNYYKDNILDRYYFVRAVFDQCGIMKILETKRNSCELKEFDVIELKKLFTDKEIEQFENLPRDTEFVKAIVKMSEACNVHINGYSCEKRTNESQNCAEITAQVSPAKVLHDFFSNYISITLNNAEYFSMAFTHNTADESVIYQSIHPTFLEMCFVMYYYISFSSDPARAKLYTNIADLYNKWRARQQSQKNEYENAQRAGSKHSGTIIVDDK